MLLYIFNKAPDIEFSELRTRGYAGSLQDMQMAYLGDQGYFGALNDRLYKNSQEDSEPTFDPEASLTGGTTYAPETVLSQGFEYDTNEDTVFAFTVPSDWGGAGSDGVVVNAGAFNGAAVVIDGDGRVGAFSSLGSSADYVLSDTGALSAGDRVVVQFYDDNVNIPRVWVEGVEITFNTQNDWAGGDDGGYLTQDADGQESGGATFPTSGTWSTMQAAPITAGTWGDLTIYRNQIVS